MRKAMMLLATAALLAGCERTDKAVRQAGNAADKLADRADNWGDGASDRVDRAGPAIQNAIARADERLEDLAGRATGTLVTDGWVGRWNGVEGLNLVIAGDPAGGAGHYTLTMRYTLDDAGVFPGRAVGDTIRFRRPDGEQVLRATDGAATGLKYLAARKDCLTVKPGEGYCRDRHGR